MRYLVLATLFIACGKDAATGPPSTVDAPPTTVSRCAEPSDVEQIELPVGKTVRSRSGIAVTFQGTTHDSYDEGRTDMLLELVFRGVDGSGELSPSALTWMPSAHGRPEWVYLQIDRCVRVLQPGERRALIELGHGSQIPARRSR